MQTHFQSKAAILSRFITNQFLTPIKESIQYISTSAFTKDKCPETELYRLIDDIDPHFMFSFKFYHTFIYCQLTVRLIQFLAFTEYCLYEEIYFK